MFLETIRIEGAQARLLELHYERMCKSADSADVGRIPYSEFADRVTRALTHSVGCCPLRYKLRMRYSSHIEDVRVERYHPRPVGNVAMMVADRLQYHSKYADRGELDRFQHVLGPGTLALFVQHGLLTDLWYANILLSYGGVWYTPAKPLLSGVMRSHLLRAQRNGTLGGSVPRSLYRAQRRRARMPIVEADIAAADIHQFETLSPINAMLDPGDVEISVSRVYRMPYPRC